MSTWDQRLKNLEHKTLARENRLKADVLRLGISSKTLKLVKELLGENHTESEHRSPHKRKFYDTCSEERPKKKHL